MRRPRGRLGTPQQQPARPQRRDVLRLLPVRRHHGARGKRPGRARAGPPDDPVLLPPGPGPRPGPRADRDARGRHPARRHHRRLRLRPPRRRRLGHPAPPGRRQLVQDLHPHDRGPRGTHHGAIIANGNLYCPQTPAPLLQLGPLPPAPTAEQTAAHDHQAAELARHKLGRHHRRRRRRLPPRHLPRRRGQDPLPAPPRLDDHSDRDRPEILTPPEHPPACCTQQTITVGPQIAAKTRQKHDYPSPQHRRSYARRTGAERTFSTIKDPATTSIARGWCRLTGLTPLDPMDRLPADRPQPAHPHRLPRPPGQTTPAAPPPACRPEPANAAAPALAQLAAGRHNNRHRQRRRATNSRSTPAPSAKARALTPVNRHR